MKGIYLGAFEAKHDGHDIIYQDINGKRDVGGDMMDIDLTPYDYIIATPPCNYWSRARGKSCSEYSKKTMHLLPDIIDKLLKTGKPFIVENVKNAKRFKEHGLFDKPCFIIEYGRHTYWTNRLVDFYGIEQRQDFKYHGRVILYSDMKNKEKHQGGFNVHNVIEYWIQLIERVK